MNPKETAQKTFTTIDGNTLMAQTFEPLRFSVDKILPHGLFIFAGSPKVGKSWLSLDLSYSIATGGKLWDFTAEQGDVLYLALEDNYSRLQNRLKKVNADEKDISRLHMTTSSFGIHDGLLEQIHSFVKGHGSTNLVVVDTLEHIRNGQQETSLYSCDYRDMNRLREITDKHKLTLLLIHHTRKMYDPDPLNTISGSTGLVGAADGVFVLEKSKRTENDAKLTIANRDTEGFCFNLRFDSEKCRWTFIGNNFDSESGGENDLAIVIDDFVKDEWNGTATELCKELQNFGGSQDLNPSTLTKRLKAQTGLFRNEYNIAIDFERCSNSRRIFLRRI